MPTYEYQPIQDPRSTRILHLDPSPNPESTPRCTLEEVSLDSPPEYEAVSYAWGPPERTEPIDCDGKTLLVTQNCLQLLRQFRHRSETSRALWIDAICINQESMDERTHQVQLMHDVYSKAKRVLIWLGEGNEESALTFSHMSQDAQRAIPGHETVFAAELAGRLRMMKCEISYLSPLLTSTTEDTDQMHRSRPPSAYECRIEDHHTAMVHPHVDTSRACPEH